MDYRIVWRLLTCVGVISAGGCASPLPRLDPVCPSPVPPPARLMDPAESPQTRQQLERLLPSTSPPVSGTPSA